MLLLLSAMVLAYFYLIESPSDDLEKNRSADPSADTREEQVAESLDSSNQTSINLPSKNQTEQVMDEDSSVAEDDESLETPVISRASVSEGNFKAVATFITTKSGDCKFLFTSDNGQTVSYTNSIVVGPSYYYCSLDIPVESLEASAKWRLVVYNQSESGSKASEPREISL